MTEQGGVGLQVRTQTVRSDDGLVKYFQALPRGDYPQGDHRKELCHDVSLLRDTQLIGDKIGGFSLDGQLQVSFDSSLSEWCRNVIYFMGNG